MHVDRHKQTEGWGVGVGRRRKQTDRETERQTDRACQSAHSSTDLWMCQHMGRPNTRTGDSQRQAETEPNRGRDRDRDGDNHRQRDG